MRNHLADFIFSQMLILESIILVKWKSRDSGRQRKLEMAHGQYIHFEVAASRKLVWQILNSEEPAH
jgi:hypothetical protein